MDDNTIKGPLHTITECCQIYIKYGIHTCRVVINSNIPYLFLHMVTIYLDFIYSKMWPQSARELARCDILLGYFIRMLLLVTIIRICIYEVNAICYKSTDLEKHKTSLLFSRWATEQHSTHSW
jgi:hypothetical protein